MQNLEIIIPKNIPYFIYLILLLFSIAQEQSDKNNYFFTMYPSYDNKTSYLLHSFTPNSEHLIIDLSKENKDEMIKKESISDFTNSISSIIFYEKDLLVKTCFGINKIVEIIPVQEINKNYDEIKTKYIYSKAGLQISKDLKYCYSTIVTNPDTSVIKDHNVIITYWVEINSDGSYSHKSLLFYPIKKQFSKVFNLVSNSLFPISKRYPIHCTTFRSRDIFCSYYDLDLNNQYVIETNKIIYENTKSPSVQFVLSDIGQIKGKNMLPISLNKQLKSIFGGYYDVFLAEFSEKKSNNKNENNTVILYSLYRKSLHASLVPMFSVLDLFFGINIRDDYIETNLFNYILEGNEMLFVFIYNNRLEAIRVDYSKTFGDFIGYHDFTELGYYSSKLDNCKNPKFMQSTYINNTIKYTEEEKKIVEAGTRQYIFAKDIVSLISCENEQGIITYVPKTIEPPQCLVDLDNLNNHEIHKINFYISIGTIIYDIYDDIRLKSFRNVGIMFYPIEFNYLGLINIEIKLKSMSNYTKPIPNIIYYDITHIKFSRVKARYVPYFTKPFHLKYRLFNILSKEVNTINKISSSVCFFQIKFFPYDDRRPYNPIILPNIYHFPYYTDKISQNTATNKIEPEEEEEEIEPDDVCQIAECSLCVKTNVKNNYNGFICQKCDSSELSVMIPDTNLKSETYGACICNISLGFKKDPVINTCYCQEDNAYYKTTNLCWPLSILENGPYYTDKIDDITEIPIYDDCYSSCAKCSKAGNETNHNCDKCKEGFVYIDDDKSNCYNKSLLNEGYHEEDKDKYIKCHDNCISCTQKPSGDKQYCTECRNNVSYFIRENPKDEYFNCFSKRCDLNEPSLLFKYDINSHECVKDCNDGVKIYKNLNICLTKCSNLFPYLDEETKLCYDNCEKNPKNNKPNNDKVTCVSEEECESDEKCQTQPECSKFREYKNKEGNCVPIPDKCLVVDADSGLCKICNQGYYPLKEELDLLNHNCYKTLEEIIKDKNKTNYYLNETEGYWDKCYETCETCYAYGSENRQRCSKCKAHYHFQSYFLNNDENDYHNCLLDLTPNENCTSSQIDMYRYRDFCHLCLNGYAFVGGFDKCYLEKELIQGPYYLKKEEMLTGDNRDRKIQVKVYYNCYKYCKTCSDKGDFYDNKCDSCINGLIYNPKSKFQNCIDPSELVIDTTYNNHLDKTDISKNTDNINDDNKSDDNESDDNKSDDNKSDDEKNMEDQSYDIENYTDYTDEENLLETDLIKDSDSNIWFNLGNNSFYIYQQGNCYLVFYHTELFLISSKESCSNICPIWSITHCPLKKYQRFKTLSKKEFNNLLSKTNVYSDIKNDINIIISEEEQKIYFQLTNNISPSPKNLSYIDLTEYDQEIKSKYGQNLLVIKADIKRNDTQSTQVEYQFFNPNDFAEKIDLDKIIKNKRRLNDENSEISKAKVNIDLPVDWTETQLENINYLSEQNINAFDSSSEFYTDNCNQFTSSKGSDVYLVERKKQYYPDITLCEDGCTFVKYNKETEKVTCKCDYKVNSDNYTKVTFVKNAKDKKFLKDLFMENLQSMKCLKVIFKWINLKSNPGFIIMIIFLILFFISGVLYYISGGFNFLNRFINKTMKDKNIFEVLKSSINPEIEKDKKPKPKDNIKISKYEGDDEEENGMGNTKPDPNNKEERKEKPGPKRNGRKKRKNSKSDISFPLKDGYDKDSVHSFYPKQSDGGDNNKNNNNKPKKKVDDNSSNNSDKNKDNKKNDKKENKKDNKKGDIKDNNNNNNNNDKEKKNKRDDDESDNGGEKNNGNNDIEDNGNKERDKQKIKKKRERRKHGDIISEGEAPENKDYDKDSLYDCYPKDKIIIKKKTEKKDTTEGENNNKEDDKSDKKSVEKEDNSDKNPDKKEDKKEGKKEKEKKEDKNEDEKVDIKEKKDKDKEDNNKSSEKSENDDSIVDNESGGEEEKKKEKKDENEDIEENEGNKEENIEGNKENPKKKKKNRRPKKSDKSMVSDAQKPENYSKDSSMLSGDGSKGRNNDMISNISSEKDDTQKLPKKEKKDKKKKKDKDKKNRSLISHNSKQKKEDNYDKDEDEISMGNMSNIGHQFFGDESKNDDDIIKEIDDKNNKKENNNEDDNLDINLNINDMISNKGDNKEDKKDKDNKGDADIIQINDIKSEISIDLPKEEEKKVENKKEEKKIEKEKEKRKNTDSSYYSKFSDLKKQKEEGFYDNDSNILRDDFSQISKNDNIYDLISENSDKANPPPKGQKIEGNLKEAPPENDHNLNILKFRVNAGLISSKAQMKSSGENFSENSVKKEEIEDNYFEDKSSENKNNTINVKKILNMNDELITLEEFSKTHHSFLSIYLADLKKHHILYFSFCHSKDDINNIYLKLSLFSISIVLYFSLNTIFMTSSKMSNAYFDTKSSSPVYVLINLFLPFIFCGIIILILKHLIMPNYYVAKIIRTIQGEQAIKEIVGLKEVEEIAKNKDIPKETRKRTIINAKNKVDNLNVKVLNDYEIEKEKLEKKLIPLYPKYKKIVIIYFLVGLIFLGINWYMMTSFCAIFKNSGVKLIVNSIISLITSFIYPCLLGIIPTLIGLLAKKLNNKIIYKVYRFINKVI